MHPHELSQQVAAFVTEHLRSLIDLQLLIAMIQSRERWWDAGMAARELGMPLSEARRVLDYLASRNLLDIRITGDVRYQFAPGTEELKNDALAMADAYRTNPFALAQLVTEPTQRHIRDFADAFRIRRDDDR